MIMAMKKYAALFFAGLLVAGCGDLFNQPEEDEDDPIVIDEEDETDDVDETEDESDDTDDEDTTSFDPTTIFKPSVHYLAPGDVVPDTVCGEYGTFVNSDGDIKPRCIITTAPISSGVTDGTAWGDDQTSKMRFPLESGPAYLNSQVWGREGSGKNIFNPNPVHPDYPGGPGGFEYEDPNYQYPWRDNFCEVRGFGNPDCPTGVGHQGQDIRPANCDNAVHWAVAAEAGKITEIGNLSLTLASKSGRVYRYLHLQQPHEPGIVEGAEVIQGQRLGKVSDLTHFANGKYATTLHLHFELWDGTVTTNSGGEITGAVRNKPKAVYSSLVESFLRHLVDHPEQADPISPAQNCNL